MNYDNWKLSSPNYSDEVSTCCGAGYEETVEDMYETNYICDKCKDACDIQDEEEYKKTVGKAIKKTQPMTGGTDCDLQSFGTQV